MSIDHAKLYRLELDLEELHANRWGTYQRTMEINNEIRQLTGDLRASNLWKPADGLAALLQPETAQRLPAEARAAHRIEALGRERVALNARMAAKEPQLAALARVVEACQRYAASAATQTPDDTERSAPALPAGPVNLAATQAEIAAVKTQRGHLAQATYCREEAYEALHSELTRAADTGSAVLRRKIAHGEVTDLMKDRCWMPSGALNLLPMFAAILGPAALMDALTPHVEAMPPSIPADERAAGLAAMDACLLELEELEEGEILRREALGEKPGRRGDANPAVVLRLRD